MNLGVVVVVVVLAVVVVVAVDEGTLVVVVEGARLTGLGVVGTIKSKIGPTLENQLKEKLKSKIKGLKVASSFQKAMQP